MNILLLVQIFETFEDTGSDRHFYFAKKLVSEGHEVTVLTANVDYKNAKKRYPNETGVFERNIDGIIVRYLPVYTNFRGSFLGRLIFFLTFFIVSLREIIRLKRIDIVYAVSTPLTVGVLGVLASKLRRKPFIFEVTDVWPDAAVHAGVVKSRTIILIAELIEKQCYKTANIIIGLTQGIVTSIQNKGVSSEKIVFVPNGVDFELFRDLSGSGSSRVRFRSGLGLDGKFVAMYLGAHGAYNSLWTILNSAISLRDADDIHFLFVGDGDEKSKLEKFAESNELENISFLDTIPRKDSVEMLAVADVFLLPNRKGEFFRGNLPNKLFDFLASARPVIVAGHGETAELVLSASAGFVVEAENSVALTEEILKCKSLSDTDRNVIGRNGRRYVEQYFDRSKHAKIVLGLIESQTIS